ncbi:MAG: hypothetical protein LC664_15045 [Flavobacteriales bacterium]|nr:hypothetical protein [Flavobacteriales bacterium]
MMKPGIPHIFTRAIIYLVVIFLSVPCSAKRDIKRDLDIPVGTSKAEKPNKSIACLSFQTVAQQVSTIEYDRLTPVPAFEQVDLYTPLFADSLQIIYASPGDFRSGVPLYIINEQYLI